MTIIQYSKLSTFAVLGIVAQILSCNPKVEEDKEVKRRNDAALIVHLQREAESQVSMTQPILLASLILSSAPVTSYSPIHAWGVELAIEDLIASRLQKLGVNSSIGRFLGIQALFLK